LIRNRRLLACLLTLAALLALPGAAHAQELYTYTASLLGGLGGSPNPDQGDGFGNTGLQLNLGMVTEARTHVDLRLGRLALDSDDSFGSLSDAELSYATIGGEYRFPEGYYDSGLYVAIGGYRLEGTRANGRSDQDTALGAAIGLTGEFEINRHLGVLIELSGHYADLEEAQVFGMAHAGISFHF
jgi:hypothetical protein